MFISMQNINFITQFFFAVLQRHCILVFLSTSHMPGYTHQNDSVNMMLIYTKNQSHPSLISSDTAKILQTRYFG